MILRQIISKIECKYNLINQIINPKRKLSLINYFLLIILIFSVGASQITNGAIKGEMGIKKDFFKQSFSRLINKSGFYDLSAPDFTGNITEDTIKLVISKGVPEIYGPELNISFDTVQQSMDIMAEFDPAYGKNKIILTNDNLKRYIDIGLKIACEYCCGAKSIVFQNGEAACGCAHSQAMRGLAAYLIQNHGSKYSNDQILRELARWKGMYFPKQMIQKMSQALQNSNFVPDVAALVMGLKLPDYGKGSQSAPLPSDIENLPGMVGGC